MQGNLLDVGCSNGEFLFLAKKRGFNSFGVEVNKNTANIAISNGLEVFHGKLEDAKFNDDYFSVVYLGDVIEHVEDPEALLKFAHRLLRPHGVLILETPDESCLARRLVRLAHRLTGGRVSLLRFFYYPAHRWYFSRQAMSAVLRRTGFGAIHFYREQTVREFGKRKVQAYGLAQTWSQRVTTALAPVSGMVPWFRNKMVVMVVK